MSRFLLFTLCLFVMSCTISSKKRRQAEDHHRIAVELLADCDYPRALYHLLKANKLDSKNFLIQYTLSTTYYFMKHYDKAYQELKKLLKNKPSLTEARLALARVYIDLGQPDQALKELSIAEKDMTYTLPLKIIRLKGLAYYNKKDYYSAKKWLDEAFSLPKGKDCFTYLQLGKVYLALGKIKDSENFLKKTFSYCKNQRKACQRSSYEYEEHLVFAQLYIKKKDKRRAKYHLNLFKSKSKNKSKVKQAEKLLKDLS